MVISDVPGVRLYLSAMPEPDYSLSAAELRRWLFTALCWTRNDKQATCCSRMCSFCLLEAVKNPLPGLADREARARGLGSLVGRGAVCVRLEAPTHQGSATCKVSTGSSRFAAY